MNKLKQNLFMKQPWGGEVIWALTDGYMVKTIEINTACKTPFIVHELKEKSIIVIGGIMRLYYGDFRAEKDIVVKELMTGWSWHIDAGVLHRYESTQKDPVRLIEISTPQFDEGFVLMDDGKLELKKDSEEYGEIIENDGNI